MKMALIFVACWGFTDYDTSTPWHKLWDFWDVTTLDACITMTGLSIGGPYASVTVKCMPINIEGPGESQ